MILRLGRPGNEPGLRQVRTETGFRKDRIKMKMMDPKNWLAAVSVLTIMAGVAHADGNFTNVTQNGSDNDTAVVQGPGNFNKAGTADGSGAPGAVLQKGDDNAAAITQSGSNNAVGTVDEGFDQKGNRNRATIEQTSDFNRVDEIQQTDRTWFGSADRNTLVVRQSGSAGGNAIGSVRQMRTNTLFFNSDPGNRATIRQTSDDNSIDTLDQEGYRNRAWLVQSGGSSNHAGTISQQGASNRLTLTFNGADNGTVGFSPILLSGTAAFANLTQSNVTQTGVGNEINDFVVTGDRNAFGFNQNGLSGNGVGGYVTGSDNQFGVYQNGNFNASTIGVSGNANEVYISQDGWFNAAIANAVGGDGNGIVVAQRDNNNSGSIAVDGGSNLVKLAQNGGALIGNNASVTVTGSGNHADIDQTKSGLGGANNLTLDIFGNNNNNNPSLTTFSGVALTAAQGTGLEPGLIRQIGSGNSITMKVGKANSNSNGNVFAFLQDGGYNTIEGSVLGSSNQAVVVQNGSSNFTSFVQSGSFNTIGVNQ
jgi:hypothetical protein